MVSGIFVSFPLSFVAAEGGFWDVFRHFFQSQQIRRELLCGYNLQRHCGFDAVQGVFRSCTGACGTVYVTSDLKRSCA